MLKTNRGFIKLLLLSLITFGIYGLYFTYKMAQEANLADPAGKRVGGLVAYIFYTMFTLGIYAFYWNYRVCEKFGVAVRSTGQQPRITGGSWLLWTIFGVLLLGIGPIVAAVKQIHLWNDANTIYNNRLYYAQQYNANYNGYAPGYAPNYVNPTYQNVNYPPNNGNYNNTGNYTYRYAASRHGKTTGGPFIRKGPPVLRFRRPLPPVVWRSSAG